MRMMIMKDRMNHVDRSDGAECDGISLYTGAQVLKENPAASESSFVNIVK
jgi:hypothetical protein